MSVFLNVKKKVKFKGSWWKWFSLISKIWKTTLYGQQISLVYKFILIQENKTESPEKMRCAGNLVPQYVEVKNYLLK